MRAAKAKPPARARAALQARKFSAMSERPRRPSAAGRLGNRRRRRRTEAPGGVRAVVLKLVAAAAGVVVGDAEIPGAASAVIGAVEHRIEIVGDARKAAPLNVETLRTREWVLPLPAKHRIEPKDMARGDGCLLVAAVIHERAHGGGLLCLADERRSRGVQIPVSQIVRVRSA